MYEPIEDERDPLQRQAVHFFTEQLVLTGDVYEIKHESEEDRDKMYQAMDMRWHIRKFIFCAGFAGIRLD